MEDLDRLFALIEMCENLEEVKKNAAALRTLGAEKTANVKLLKEIKYAKQDNEKDLRQIGSQREALSTKEANIKRRENELAGKVASFDRKARESEKVEREERSRLAAFQKELDVRDQKVSKREKDIDSKAGVLGVREKDIQDRAANLANAVTRAQGA